MLNKLDAIKKDMYQNYADIVLIINQLELNSSVNVDTVNKSCVILMLYNLIEGTCTNLLVCIFDYICDNTYKFDQLQNKMQNFMLNYHLKKINNNHQELHAFWRSANIANVTYEDIKKYHKFFSGNLDARLIRKTFSDLGVDISSSVQGENLEKVKKLRNSLAHGEISFRNAARDFTKQDLRYIATEIFEFLEMIIKDCDNFIEYKLIAF